VQGVAASSLLKRKSLAFQWMGTRCDAPDRGDRQIVQSGQSDPPVLFAKLVTMTASLIRIGWYRLASWDHSGGDKVDLGDCDDRPVPTLNFKETPGPGAENAYGVSHQGLTCAGVGLGADSNALPHISRTDPHDVTTLHAHCVGSCLSARDTTSATSSSRSAMKWSAPGTT
jgi:hypothetical protein